MTDVVTIGAGAFLTISIGVLSGITSYLFKRIDKLQEDLVNYKDKQAEKQLAFVSVDHLAAVEKRLADMLEKLDQTVDRLAASIHRAEGREGRRTGDQGELKL